MATENMQIAQSSDDAEEADTTVTLNLAYLRMYNTGYTVGFRFVPDSAIPQGSTIVSATLSWKYTSTDWDSMRGTAYGEDGAAPGTFTTGASDIDNRTKTTASAAIVHDDEGLDWVSIDVSSILDELTTDYEISAIVIIITDNDAAYDCRIVAWDGDVDNCAKLDVEYSTSSESASASASPSASASASPSATLSPSASASSSPSASLSPSASASASPSPSPAEMEVVWGHDTGVLEANVRDFDGNWTGTGTIENPGIDDTERICLESGQNMISEVVATGAVDVVILYNVYAAGDAIDLDYRHGDTVANCLAAGWIDYAGAFTSLGFVQARISSTL